MRFAVPFVALLAVVSSASATLFARQNIPACAALCLANVNTACSETNYLCLCTDKAFLNATSTCVKSMCSGSDIQAAETVAEDLCKAVGIVLATTTISATASTTASTTASATSTEHSNGASLISSNSMFVGIAAVLVIAAV